MKIATILPYKENYTISRAQAAAIWVSDFYKLSKYKKENFIYGNTKGKDFLTKNYKNVKLKTLNSIKAVLADKNANEKALKEAFESTELALVDEVFSLI